MAERREPRAEVIERNPYGYVATAKIRHSSDATLAGMPVVALTANSMPGDEQKCLGAGMNDFLAKPYTLSRLRRVLARWLPVDSMVDWPTPANAKMVDRQAGVHEAQPIDKQTIEALRELDPHGGIGLARELIGTFLQSADASMQRVVRAVTEHDAASLAQAAHALKSSTANVGALRLSECFRELERIGREGRVAEAAGALDCANAEFERAIASLRSLMEQKE